MQIKAKVVRIGETEQVSQTFKKRELIVEYAENPSYPETLKFEAVQDKVSIFDGLQVGQEVEVNFNLRGRESKGNVYNSLQVWKISK